MQKLNKVKWTMIYRLRSNIDDCIQKAMLKCMQVWIITAVRPTVTEKLTKMEKLKKVTGSWNTGNKWPRSKLNLEIIKTNILSKIHDDHFKNVTPRVLNRFSFDLAWCHSFLLQVTQFQTWPWNPKDKHFEQDSWWLLQKCCPLVC